MKILRNFSAIGSFSSKCCSLILVVVRRRKEEIVDYQVIMQIEIAATLLPRGIFRARPTGSCCINSSLDLSLGSDGLAFPPPFSWWLFQPLVTISPIACNFSAEQGVEVFSEFSSLFPAASRSVLAFLFECKHPVLSSKLHSVPPLPLLSHELNHPTHDSPPTSASESGGGNDRQRPESLTMTAAWWSVCPLTTRLPPPSSFLANLRSVAHVRWCNTWHWGGRGLYGTDIQFVGQM